jgi:hypothetical protein
MLSDLSPSNIDVGVLHLMASDRSIQRWDRVLIADRERIHCLPPILTISGLLRSEELFRRPNLLLRGPGALLPGWSLKTTRLPPMEAVPARVSRQQLSKSWSRELWPEGVNYLILEPWVP